MQPKFVAVSGPLQGESFDATANVTIGRDPSNTVHISDVAVSRQHAVINRGQLFDLDSLNGTFVNGIPIKERILEHGDRIDIGNSQFVYLLKEEQELAAVQFDESQPPLSTIFLNRSRVELDPLLKFASEIHRIRKKEALQERFLELVFDSIPAQKGAILFTSGSAENYSSIHTRNRNSDENPLSISRTIANQVLSRQESVLCNDIEQDFKEAPSVFESSARSILCAPIFIAEKAEGLVYLSSDARLTFQDEHLQLLTAMTSIASIAFENLRHLEWLIEENKTLRSRRGSETGLLGESEKIKEAQRFIDKAGPSGSTVLILGETGTGKELVARALHEKSARANKPFVAINCASLSEPLLESELFGHERGAFTGAIAQKKGKLEIADQGTVFLDEVAELTPLLQAKLLRVLQERQFERVGGTQPIHVDIRLLAATNRNLKDAIKAGRFREDLFYRLNVISVQLAPLRERSSDIPLLATYFASQFAAKFQRRIQGISPEARKRLMNYQWPGNVRELENAIEHAVVLGTADSILPEDLPESLLESSPAEDLSKYHEGVQETKKQLILKAVENAQGNLTEAAKLLGVHPNYLHRLIRNLGLRELLKK
jgi:two-component system, NtrC family, response regulator HydG